MIWLGQAQDGSGIVNAGRAVYQILGTRKRKRITSEVEMFIAGRRREHNGLMRNIIQRRAWRVLHSVAVLCPSNPTSTIQGSKQFLVKGRKGNRSAVFIQVRGTRQGFR